MVKSQIIGCKATDGGELGKDCSKCNMKPDDEKCRVFNRLYKMKYQYKRTR